MPDKESAEPDPQVEPLAIDKGGALPTKESAEPDPQVEPLVIDKGALPSVLTQLGLILAPAGVIALFCQVLDVSPQSTAAVSLAAVFLTSICVYRRFINRYFPSALLTALLIGLATVFFFNYQNILLKDTGLIRYYKHSNDFLAQIDTEINRSEHEIWFVGMDFNISSGERRDLLLKKLESGVKVRYLIFDPRSSHLDDLAKDFNQSPEELRAECEKGIQSILQLQKDWQAQAKVSSSPGELTVRVFATHPHARFYVFDPDRTQGTTYFVPYLNSVNSPSVPGFLLQNVKTGVFSAYFDSILKLWATSSEFTNYTQSSEPVK